MKKRLWMFVLLAQALAAHAAHAETDRSHLRLDNALSTLKLHKVSSLKVISHIALIFDEQTQLPLYNKNAKTVVPIASITKLMTAMVVLDARLPMDEAVSVAEDDPNTIKRARSRLRIGMTFTRSEMLKLALMASENRAALALARSYPGGTVVLVAAMNAKARVLGMQNTRFFDPTGLDSDNVSTAQDLVKMVAAARHMCIRDRRMHSMINCWRRVSRFTSISPAICTPKLPWLTDSGRRWVPPTSTRSVCCWHARQIWWCRMPDSPESCAQICLPQLPKMWFVSGMDMTCRATGWTGWSRVSVTGSCAC